MLNKNRSVDEGLIKAIKAFLRPEDGFFFKLKEPISYYELKDLFLFLELVGGKYAEGLEVGRLINYIYNEQAKWKYIGIGYEGDIDIYYRHYAVKDNFIYCFGDSKIRLLDDGIRDTLLILKELYTKPRCSPSSASLIKK